MSENIQQQDSLELYIEDMVKYSIIVNRRRAIPETRDGLKLVQRRLIYDIYKQGAYGNKFIKSSAITGDTMKLYHPHGDSSLYTALEPMTNWYSCKYPIIRGKGNWGTVMGDPPAAARYTEAMLSEFGMDCIVGELKDTKYVVDWIDNYQRTDKEPEYLPVKVPILILNGAMGIGVGMSTLIPPHNIVEVCEQVRALIRDPNHEVILYPDHCQPCTLIASKEEFAEISRSGVGKYRIRGHVSVEEDKNGYPTIYIRSLPDGVSTQSVIDRLNNMIVAKQLPMVRDISDASQKSVDIRIQLRKGSDPTYVIQTLYAKTDVQTTFSVNCEAVKGTDPGRFNYKSYLMDFIHNRTMLKFRLYCNKLQIANTRYHQLIAYIKLIESGEMDNVVNMIKKQEQIDDNYLVEYLVQKIKVTDLQAKFILGTDIRRLAKGYLTKYKEEAAKLEQNMAIYQNAITDNGDTIMQEIDQELAEIEQKYGAPRCCDLATEEDATDIPKGNFTIVLTRKNLIRKLPETEKVNSVRGDDPKYILQVENTQSILVFDNRGKCFKLPVSKIPVTDRSSSGTDIRILVKGLSADIISIVYEPTLRAVVESKHKHYFVVATRMNTIKKLELEDFLNVSVSGLLYSKVKDGDAVVGLVIAPAELDVVIYSDSKALRTSLKNIPMYKRNAAGCRAMGNNSILAGVEVIYPDQSEMITVTNNGIINHASTTDINEHGRGTGGVNVIRLKNGDSIHSVRFAAPGDIVRILTTDKIIDLPVDNITKRTSVASGNPISGFNKSASMVKVEVFRAPQT